MRSPPITSRSKCDNQKDKQPMKFYIAGPTVGIPQFNTQAFLDAATWLAYNGHDEVISTIHLDQQQGWDWSVSEEGHEFDRISAGYTIKQMMARNLGYIFSTEALLLLDGWKDSKQCWLELAAARWARSQIYVSGALGESHIEASSWTMTPFNPANGYGDDGSTISVVDPVESLKDPEQWEEARADIRVRPAPTVDEIVDVIRDGRDEREDQYQAIVDRMFGRRTPTLDELANLVAAKLQDKDT